MLHHEIIIVDKKKQEVKIERYYNNGKQVLSAYFKERLYEGDQPSLFFEKDDSKLRVSGLSKSGKWKFWNPDGELIQEIDYSDNDL